MATTECRNARRICHRSADFDTVRQIKERLCYMAYDLEQESKVSRKEV